MKMADNNEGGNGECSPSADELAIVESVLAVVHTDSSNPEEKSSFDGSKF
jgi:hypothetical protein